MPSLPTIHRVIGLASTYPPRDAIDVAKVRLDLARERYRVALRSCWRDRQSNPFMRSELEVAEMELMAAEQQFRASMIRSRGASLGR